MSRGNLAVFLTGLSGSHEFEIHFRGAVRSLSAMLIHNNYSYDQMIRFGEEIEEDVSWGFSDKITLGNLEKKISELAEGAAFSNVFIFIAGHANGRDEESKLHVSGEDISYSDLMKLLDQIPARQEVMILAIPQGQIWIEKMSKPGRVIVVGGGLREFDFIPTLFLQIFPNMFRAAETRASPDDASFSNLADVFMETQKRVYQWYVANSLKQTEISLLDADGDAKGDTLIQGALDQYEPAQKKASEASTDEEISSKEQPVFKKWLPEETLSSLAMNPNVSDAVEARKIIFKVSEGVQNV